MEVSVDGEWTQTDPRGLGMARAGGHENDIHEVTGSIPVSSIKSTNDLGGRSVLGVPRGSGADAVGRNQANSYSSSTKNVPNGGRSRSQQWL